MLKDSDVENGPLKVLVEGLNDAKRSRMATNFGQDLHKAVSAHEVKGLGEV